MSLPDVPLNFLFVGVEPAFTAYFFTKEVALNASLDSCRTIKDARQKLQTSLYDVYVVDLSESDALSLVQEIRIKTPSCIIAMTAKEGAWQLDLQALQTLHIVNYILLKPLEPQAVDEMFKGLLKHFAKDSQDEKDLLPSSSESDHPLVYLVDPDRSFLELLNKMKASFPFELQIDSDPKQALASLNKENFKPQVLIISDTFPGSSLTAFDIIENKQLKERNPSLITALILGNGLGKDDMKTRVKAMAYNVNYVFHKPIYANTLLKSIEEILQVRTRQNFRVLILDDDKEFCGFVSEILKDAGMEVLAIYEGEELFKAIDEFKPQLLLLDLMLPQFNGLDLLRTLRQDVTYSDLDIVIITSAEESSTRLLAYSAKADDIIYKPIDPILFQKRMTNFSERHSSKEHSNSDKEGMGSLKELTAAIHTFLEEPEHAPHFLALFEVDQFNEWVKTHSQQELKELLISISNQIFSELEQGKLCYILQGSKHALLFQEESLESISIKMNTLLRRLAERESHSSIHFNCSITPILTKYGNAEQNLKIAEQTLLESAKKEDQSVKMTTVSSDEDKQKEIVLVDGDLQLLKILKTTFESHGIAVTTFSEGEAAIDNLLKRPFEDLPSLLIVERKLIDMDGIDILIKLKIHFKKSVPCYILTFFASDKDILDGIKQGALEYITKPFNTSILIEKALKVISHEPLSV